MGPSKFHLKYNLLLPNFDVDFFNHRKQNYAIIIYDDRCRNFQFSSLDSRAVCTWCSSPPKMRIYQGWTTRIFIRKAISIAIFCIWVNEQCIRGGNLSQNQKGFNSRRSALRIKIEARFSSLRALPLRLINSTEKFNWCLAWIGSCVILHSICLSYDYWVPSQVEFNAILLEIARESESGYDRDSDNEDNNNSYNQERNSEVQRSIVCRRELLLQKNLDTE